MHEWLCCCSMGKRRKKGHVAEFATWLARRAEVVELVRLGYNYKSIASTKRVSVGFVAAAVKRYKETKSHCDRSRSGASLKATPAVSKKVESLLRDKKVGSVRKARAKLRGKGIDLSIGTVHNIAHREGLRSAVPIPKPKLTPEHRAARLAWVNTNKDDDEEKIRKLVFADEKRFLVTDATHRVWLRPCDPTPIRETRKRHACSAVFVFAVLHSQYTACRPPSRCSSSSSPSLHAPCLIVVLLVCCRVFSCVVEKFAATVSISAVITSYGAASCVLLQPNTSLTGESYRDLLKDFHIPAVQTKFSDNDFIWIQVHIHTCCSFGSCLSCALTTSCACWWLVEYPG
jgi:transposase